MRTLKYSEAINEALHIALDVDPKVLACGLGINDPKRIFGTTTGLVERFGHKRVFEIPVSESAITGLCVGAAIGGYKPVLMHQRVDFSLVSIDQIVNSAAKWFFMFGGQRSVPIVVRMVVGRGWGQGPTHSQSLHSWFSHIPGLKVVMPASPADAKGLLLASIFDPNPVLFFEHRWLHDTSGHVPTGFYKTDIGSSKTVLEGMDVTIVANSLMVVEAQLAAKNLSKLGINCEIIDLRSVRPIDWDNIGQSVRRTGRLIALDVGHPTASIASEVVAYVSENFIANLKCAPQRLCLPDHAVPTSYALTKDLYPGARNVAELVGNMLGVNVPDEIDFGEGPHDVPGAWFKGPF